MIDVKPIYEKNGIICPYCEQVYEEWEIDEVKNGHYYPLKKCPTCFKEFLAYARLYAEFDMYPIAEKQNDEKKGNEEND